MNSLDRKDHPRRRRTDVAAVSANRVEPPSCEDWSLQHSDLDDLENSLRYLEREDPGAWRHVTMLLQELRTTVE